MEIWKIKLPLPHLKQLVKSAQILYCFVLHVHVTVIVVTAFGTVHCVTSVREDLPQDIVHQFVQDIMDKTTRPCVMEMEDVGLAALETDCVIVGGSMSSTKQPKIRLLMCVRVQEDKYVQGMEVLP